MSGSLGGSKRAYIGTLAIMGLALAFPILLMIFNPTLMFRRGWEQYAGTSLYFWALGTLAFELRRLWSEEKAFEASPALTQSIVNGDLDVAVDEPRLLPSRLRQLFNSKGRPAAELMELNREASGLDQEQAAGRFTLPKYILYLLPVIGFIGTVEGISHALMNISRVLPMVKNLDDFMNNLTSVTSALQVAFDSTLLALFLSASLMLVQTLIHRRCDEVLARVDRWVVEHALPRLGGSSPGNADLGPMLAKLDMAIRDLGARLGDGLGPHVERFASTVDRLPQTMAGFERGAVAMERVSADLGSVASATESLRRGVATLGRIESTLGSGDAPSDRLDEIKRSVDKAGVSIESLSQSFASAYERSNRQTQDQLARTLNNLKDALELIHVSIEQGNSLYRTIVKKMMPTMQVVSDDQAAA